jgi:hypothetical protein
VADPEERRNAERGDRHLSEAGREKDARQATPGNDNKRVVLAIAISGVVLLVSASYSFLAMNADKQQQV